ncbi:MAG: hypothetical protein HND46_22605 [Chloroflexi bacterium]|nr:hypothetical protein [Chloroflexota bacterium]NOG66213.1 hypothetical protein [Chloroflexota bacterium]
MRKIISGGLLLFGVLIFMLNMLLAYFGYASPRHWLLLYEVPSGRTGKMTLHLNMSGVEDQQLKFEGDGVYTPVLSPDQRQLAWAAISKSDGRSRIYFAPVVGVVSHRATKWVQYDEQYPAWSKDGQWIYFISWGIYRVSLESGIPELVVQPTDPNAYISAFSLSPNNKQIAFIQSGNNASYRTIGIWQSNGTLMRPILENGYEIDSILNWSADGSSILFSAMQSLTTDAQIYRFWPESQHLELVEELNAAEESFQKWSPDENWIVYIDGNMGNRYLIRKQRITGKTERLTSSFDQIWEVVWSQDNQWIAFSASGTHGGLYVMRSNGENMQRVAPNGVADVFWFSSNYQTTEPTLFSFTCGIISTISGMIFLRFPKRC